MMHREEIEKKEEIIIVEWLNESTRQQIPQRKLKRRIRLVEFAGKTLIDAMSENTSGLVKGKGRRNGGRMQPNEVK